jgi:hypothetical protein
MKRTLVLVLVVAVVAAGVAIAAVTVSSNAAVVNGTAISRQQLNSDLAAIAQSQSYQCYVRLQGLVETGQAPPPLHGTGGGKDATNGQTATPVAYSSSFAGFWLNQMIYTELLTQLNARRGVELTSYDLQRGHAALERQMNQVLNAGQQSGVICGGSASTVLSTLPASFVDRLAERQAAQIAYILDSEGTRLSPAAVARYFDNHRHAFDTVCVVVLPLQSASQASQVTAAVAAGTPFATLAQNAGGGSTCGSAALSTPLAAAARLKPGEISAPITYGQSVLLLQLTAIHPASLSSSTDDVVQAMVGKGGAGASANVARAQRESHVDVDPRYGHWVAAPAFTVFPPTSPPASSLLCPSANDPTATASVCPPPVTVHPATGHSTTIPGTSKAS